MFQQIEGLISPALYLELAESHGNIFVPYIVRGNMGTEILYIKNSPVNAGTFIELLYLGMKLTQLIGRIGVGRMFFHVIRIVYLLQADSPVMFGTSCTGRVTAGIYEYLTFLLPVIFSSISNLLLRS